MQFYPIYRPDQIRAAEKPLLEKVGGQLMRHAAFAVAVEAAKLLPRACSRVLVLVGPGNNGGDALFAAAELARRGHRIILWSTGDMHPEGIETLRRATVPRDVEDFLPEPLGQWVDEPDTEPADMDIPAQRQSRLNRAAKALRESCDLVIDGLLGVGARPPLRAPMARITAVLRLAYLPTVAVDIPTGVDPITGEFDADGSIAADVTVTFGGLKPAHVLAGRRCGKVVVKGLGIDTQLREDDTREWALLDPEAEGLRVEAPDMDTFSVRWPLPGPTSDKYNGGVVGVRAGSEKYPGAALLCVAGAVRATSPMVRYMGPNKQQVVDHFPAVVAGEGRVQAFVTGPGSGGDGLAEDVGRNVPLLLDADALTAIAQDEELAARLRSRRAWTLLTPHAGEYERLMGHAPAADRVAAAKEMAAKYNCAVLLKGKVTTIVGRPGFDQQVFHVVAPTSFAATPGSGDVLAGAVGAVMATVRAPEPDEDDLSMCWAVANAAFAHALAAASYGAPCDALQIAEALPAVIAAG